MRTYLKIAVVSLALTLPGCIHVGPEDDKPLHIILDVNIKIQIDKDVQQVWDSVEALAKGISVDTPDAAGKENK